MDDIDKREVLRFLMGIENGNLSIHDMFTLVQKFDPLLSYFLLKYLRDKHPITENSSGAGQRLLDFLTSYPEVANLVQKPAKDPMIEWFSDSYTTKSFFASPHEYVDLIVDKLDG